MGDTVTIHPASNGAVVSPPTRLQDRVPLDAIMADAKQARPGRAILGLIGFVLFTIGWTVAKAAQVLFLAGAFLFSSVKIGWRTARGEPLNQPNLEDVLAENRALRLQLERIS